MRPRRAGCVACGLIALWPVAGRAGQQAAQGPRQGQPPARLARIEVSGAAGAQGGIAFGRRDATLRPADPSGAPYQLFSAETARRRAASFAARVGYTLSPVYAIEVRAGLARPVQETRLSADVEDAAGSLASGRVSEYMFDGGVRVSVPALGAAGMVPFATAGAGVLRQLQGGRALVEVGPTYYVGAGIRRAWRTVPAGVVRSVGFRADVRVDVLAGPPVADRSRRRPSAGVGLFVTF